MNFEEFVLAVSTADLAEGEQAVVRENADAVEFRMDLADSPRDQLADYDGELPVIATNRVEWEGGEAPDTDERIEDLRWAAQLDTVGAIDVELEAIRRGDTDGLESTSEAAVIVSIHDFDRTPESRDLHGLLEEATDHGDVGKLAVTAETIADVPRLLAITAAFAARDQPVATMAMGPEGQHSRAVAPLYGSCIGYAPADPDEATAPGQYDLETLRNLVETLKDT